MGEGGEGKMTPGRGREYGECHRHEKSNVTWLQGARMKIGQDQTRKVMGRIVGFNLCPRESILSRFCD